MRWKLVVGCAPSRRKGSDCRNGRCVRGYSFGTNGELQRSKKAKRESKDANVGMMKGMK